jgi:hypothetical protein
MCLLHMQLSEQAYRNCLVFLFPQSRWQQGDKLALIWFWKRDFVLWK